RDGTRSRGPRGPTRHFHTTQVRRPEHRRDQEESSPFFPDIPIWPGLADVGPDTEFVGNPVTIRTTDGRSYSARVDIPRGDPALPLTDDELLEKYRDCALGQLRPDDINRSVSLVRGLEKVGDAATL